MPTGAGSSHPINMASHITPPPYLHGLPIMDSRQVHMPSPPVSQPGWEAHQSAQALQQELINGLREEKDRLVSDKDRLMNDKDKLVNEKISLVDDTRSLLEDKERTLKEANDLLTSKSVLWQDCYRAVGERDEEIKTLKHAKSAQDEEIKRLKEANSALDHANGRLKHKLEKQRNKNVELAQALEDMIEKDDGDGDDAVEDGDGDLPLARPINEIIYEDFLREKQVHELDDDVEGEDARAVRLEAKAKLEVLLQANATPVPRAAKVERTSSWLESVDQPADPQTESRRQLEEIFGGAAEVGNDNGRVEDTEPPAKRAKLSPQASASITPHSDPPEPLPTKSTDVTLPLEVSCEQPCSRPETPPPPEKCSVVLKYGHALAIANPPVSEARTQSPSPVAEEAEQSLSPVAEEAEQSPAKEAAALLAKLQSDLLVPKLFTVRPVTSPSDAATKEYGNMAHLTPESLKSLVDTFERMDEMYKTGKCAKKPTKLAVKGCAHVWASSSASSCKWTKDRPRVFACHGCYKNRRLCLLWQGYGYWDILPLPERVRVKDTTYKDNGYYIASGVNLSTAYRSIWEPACKKPKKATELVEESP